MHPQIDSRTSSDQNSHSSLFLSHCVLNKGTDEELTFWGYKKSVWREVTFWTIVVLTLGVFLLLVYWKPELACYLRRKKCALYKAQFVLLKTCYGMYSVVPILLLTEPVDGAVNYKAANDTSEHLGGYTENTSVTSELLDDRTRLSSSWMSDQASGVRYFDYQKTRYTWDQNKFAFCKLEDLSSGITCFVLHEKFRGLSEEQRAARLRLYGSNTMVIDVPSYFTLFFGEVLNPFYIFQIASIILWAVDEYYYYAACIFFISGISIGISLRETKRQRVTLKNMVATDEGVIKVASETQEFIEKPDSELVPGDLIFIPPNGCVMTCDAVLTAGTCIVNESMLTGESVPVTKTPLLQQEDEEIYTPDTHKRHTLFSGTKIVQTRYYGQAKVTAVVVRTGFNTAKGELVRAILFPKPLDFKFYRDAIRFILFLAFVASLGMIYSLVTYVQHGEDVRTTVLRVLDIVTIVVPPALPAAMTVGTVYAQSRLKKSKIFCISPPRINFCGRINVFCFDKTGTLTEDGLDMWGVVPVEDQRFLRPVPDPSTLVRGPLIICLAACHSLTIIDGELSGDPLDLIMFNAIKWYLEEPGTDTHKYDTIMPTVVKPYSSETFLGEEEEFEYLQHELSQSYEDRQQKKKSNGKLGREIEHPFEVGIIRQFTFSSSSQRMSVITRTMGENHMDIYCKGAPEKIASLCKPETVPPDFHAVLHSYSIQGFRVIALAHRPMDPKITWHQVQRISRDKVEKDLQFLGLLVMQNQLKPQTAPVIKTLKEANIRTIMVTGDMIQTAVSVARNCGMVGKQDRVILVHAHPPDKEQAARIEWEEAEHPRSTESEAIATYEESDQESAPLLSEDNRKAFDSLSCPDKTHNTVALDFDLGRKHLAIGGKSFSIITTYFPELLPKICVQGTIFARMSPDQKCQLIEQLQELDYTVGMCGDGANDCEALKAAHAGISLSEAEASVAAPFTSSINNIECVVTAMREGRAALVTSFGCFKYMALYSFIQFISILILYTYQSNLTDFEFLYIDLLITTTVAILMGNTAAYEKLVNRTPPSSLVKLSNLVSIVVQVVLVIIFQVGGFFYLDQQGFFNNSTDLDSWDNCTKAQMIAIEESTGKEREVYRYESTVIFLLSCVMYIAVAYTFSKGPPFRKPIYTNYAFLITLIALFGLSTFLMLYSWEPFLEFMQMRDLCDHMKLRLILLATAVGFMFLSCFTEWIIVDKNSLKCLFRALRRMRKHAPSRYKIVQMDIKASNWPPVDQVMLSASACMAQVSQVVVEVNSNSVHY